MCGVLHKRLARLLLVLVCAGAPGEARLLAAPAPAAPAGEAKPKPAKPLTAAEIAGLKTKLFADDEATAADAAKKLGGQSNKAAAAPLIERLATGTVPSVAEECANALESLREPKAIQVLTLLSGNRNVPVRRAAVKALGVLPDARVSSVLLERLGDSAPEVRAVAAEALAARKYAKAADRLFKLVAKNDSGAAAPLGTLIAPDDVPKLAELRGRADDGILAVALGEFLKRPSVADRLRVDVVRTLGRMPGAASTTALVEYVASVPVKDTRPSREEAQKVVDSRGPL